MEDQTVIPYNRAVQQAAPGPKAAPLPPPPSPRPSEAQQVTIIFHQFCLLVCIHIYFVCIYVYFFLITIQVAMCTKHSVII